MCTLTYSMQLLFGGIIEHVIILRWKENEKLFGRNYTCHQNCNRNFLLLFFFSFSFNPLHYPPPSNWNDTCMITRFEERNHWKLDFFHKITSGSNEKSERSLTSSTPTRTTKVHTTEKNYGTWEETMGKGDGGESGESECGRWPSGEHCEMEIT